MSQGEIGCFISSSEFEQALGCVALHVGGWDGIPVPSGFAQNYLSSFCRKILNQISFSGE